MTIVYIVEAFLTASSQPFQTGNNFVYSYNSVIPNINGWNISQLKLFSTLALLWNISVAVGSSRENTVFD